MERVINWVKNHAFHVLAVPAAIGSLEFVANLLTAASDSIITKEELHHLVAMASPSQVILIGVVTYAIKGK